MKGATSVALDRREQLARLFAIESRSLLQLPPPELGALRSTTNARESGIEFRGPDALLAEIYLGGLRDDAARDLASLGDALRSEASAAASKIERAAAVLDELARAVDLVETLLRARAHNPLIAVGDAVERAAKARSQRVVVEGDVGATVRQVRGMLRLVSELVASVGGAAYVHVTREAGWVELAVAPNATGTPGAGAIPSERVELLRLAAYLMRARVERDGGAWRLTIVAADDDV